MRTLLLCPKGEKRGHAVTVNVSPPSTNGGTGKTYQKEVLTNSGGSGKILNEKIANGDITLKLNRDKQLPHMADTRESGKSYFNISYDELQQILNEKHGTGYVKISKSGQIKEIITLDSDVGVCVSYNGDNIGKTNRFTVHYSKTRTHCVPAKRRP